MCAAFVVNACCYEDCVSRKTKISRLYIYILPSIRRGWYGRCMRTSWTREACTPAAQSTYSISPIHLPTSPPSILHIAGTISHTALLPLLRLMGRGAKPKREHVPARLKRCRHTHQRTPACLPACLQALLAAPTRMVASKVLHLPSTGSYPPRAATVAATGNYTGSITAAWRSSLARKLTAVVVACVVILRFEKGCVRLVLAPDTRERRRPSLRRQRSRGLCSAKDPSVMPPRLTRCTRYR